MLAELTRMRMVAVRHPLEESRKEVVWFGGLCQTIRWQNCVTTLRHSPDKLGLGIRHFCSEPCLARRWHFGQFRFTWIACDDLCLPGSSHKTTRMSGSWSTESFSAFPSPSPPHPSFSTSGTKDNARSYPGSSHVPLNSGAMRLFKASLA